MASTQEIVFDVLRSGGFSTTHSRANDWVRYVDQVGLEAGLKELNRVMPKTDISAYVGQPQQQQQQQQRQLPGTHLVTNPQTGIQYNITAPGGGTDINLANLVNSGNWAALDQYKVSNIGTGVPIQQVSSEVEAANRAAIERAMQSGNYNTSKLDEWTDYANREGLEKALIEFQKNNPGSGANVTNISKDLGKASAERILSQVSSAGLPGAAAAIPAFNVASLYRPTNFQTQPQTQPSLYPTQQTMGLRAALQTPSLIAMPTAQPTLTPQTAYVTDSSLLAESGIAPTLNAQAAYIGAGVPTTMREGGLASAAQNVAAEGRRGDSMLVHMTPDEVAGLQSLAQMMGGSLTINPETGLPEANFLKKILPIVAAVAAPYLAPVVGGSALAGAALAGGLAAGGTMLGGGSLSQGIKTGLMATTAAGLSAGAMGSDPLGATTGSSTFNLGNTFGGAKAAGAVDPSMGGVDVTGTGLTGEEFYGDLSKLTRGEQGLMTAEALQPAAAASGAAKTAGMKIDPITGALVATTVYGGAKGLEENKEQQKLYEQQLAADAEERRRRRSAGYAAYERSGLANIPMGAGGGLVAMAGGGMTYMEAGGTTGPTGAPRDVTGTGDGMSDSVPATIEGVQEARLADGEFVIPADVVADIGNGSSDAGSKKLYDMMDRIRKARHGTTEQPPEIDAEALMPA